LLWLIILTCSERLDPNYVRLEAGMTTGMTCRNFVRATVGALFVTVAICTTVVADDVKRVSVNSTELSYVEAGQGEPVIFVHGGLQDYRMWAEHLPKFAGRYRAIAYSRRNHFPNDVSPDDLPDAAADTHGEDLAAFVRALGLSRVRIVAHSSGAHAALFFATRHPDMLVSLALNEPPATGLLAGVPDIADTLKEWGGKQVPAREAAKAGDAQRAIPLFVDVVGGPGAYERRSAADKKMNLDNVASFQADATTKLPRPVFTCEMAKAISAPTLLTSGERSPKFFYLIIDRLESCLPSRERIAIAGSSHTVPSESPEAYRQAVLAFLGKH
jgi:non-heme chloroperoxidase